MDLRTRTKQVGAKEKARRRKCDVRFSLNEEKYMRTGARKLLRTGLVPAKVYGGQAVDMTFTEKSVVEEANGSSSRKEEIGVAVTFHGSEHS